MGATFYLPEQYWPEPARREAWKSGAPVKLEGSGKIATAQAWIFQTWAELSRAGNDVALSPAWPASGLGIALAGTLPREFRPPRGTFLVAVAADGLPHPSATLNLVQNSRHARQLPYAEFIPHWPQPGLLPREPSRGERIDTVRFFGDARNLAPDLRDPSFARRLRRQLDIDFATVEPAGWHDYRGVDCALAIRPTGGAGLRKPGTKMYNAWLAGVPFIGGPDSAYASDGRAGDDYLLCRSAGEVFAALEKLKISETLRKNLVASGTRSAAKFSPTATARRWQATIERAEKLAMSPSPIRRLIVRLAAEIDRFRR